MKHQDLIVDKKGYKGDKYEDHLLEQYKTMVESIERVSDRRAAHNSYLLSIQTFLISISGYLLTKNEVMNEIPISILVCLFGISLSIYWIFALNNYRNLNRSKFEVLNLIEKHLPFEIFTLEWNIITSEKGLAHIVILIFQNLK